MTDRELLGLAAKAAGIKYTVHQVGYDHYALYIPEERDWWMPLADDGDALRLAVKLGMRAQSITENKVSYVDGVEYQLPVMVNHNGDPYAATRRAIVRAAAEIGKEMP